MSEVNEKTNVKSLIEFDQEHSNSIKVVMVKQNSNIKPTTTFISGNMLMFAKVSIKSFVCDIIDVFMFQTKQLKALTKNIGLKNAMSINVSLILTVQLLILFSLLIIVV